jgi:2-C-methyl-D-erythritol 2,4-cyclodiphosphate synthase
MKIRTGIGYDVHQLEEGREFWLGGIKIDSDFGCIAHSDGDVLIHAICDALLGAAAMRDIGYHFPDNSDKYKGIDSKILLKKTVHLLREEGYEISNIDSVVCLEKPKLKEYIFPMRETLANILKIDLDEISIKATTTEKLGFVGKGEGISAYATVLIIK